MRDVFLDIWGCDVPGREVGMDSGVAGLCRSRLALLELLRLFITGLGAVADVFCRQDAHNR